MIEPYYEDDLVRLFHGDAAGLAGALESGSVQTIVTSPPYWGLRDYDTPGQLGLEETVHEYVDRLVAVFAALRPALADDGTLWLNLGDSYSAKHRGSDAGWDKSRLTNPARVQKAQSAALRRNGQPSRGALSGIPEKNLIGVPWRVALALQGDGWVLRSDIIWAKPNPMPESVEDRPTRAHEYLFLLAKSPRYFYDAEAIAEPSVSRSPSGNGFARPESISLGGSGSDDRWLDVGGTRNRRDVWSVPTVPFGASHFAVYPPELIRPCILAGSRPGDLVLDPFSGSGTTGMVATQEGRRYVGFDVNAEYLDLSPQVLDRCGRRRGSRRSDRRGPTDLASDRRRGRHTRGASVSHRRHAQRELDAVRSCSQGDIRPRLRPSHHLHAGR